MADIRNKDDFADLAQFTLSAGLYRLKSLIILRIRARIANIRKYGRAINTFGQSSWRICNESFFGLQPGRVDHTRGRKG